MNIHNKILDCQIFVPFKNVFACKEDMRKKIEREREREVI